MLLSPEDGLFEEIKLGRDDGVVIARDGVAGDIGVAVRADNRYGEDAR